MAEDVRIIKIRMTAGGTKHEHITHVASSTKTWTRASAVSAIEDGSINFYVLANSLHANVGVVKASPKYLRTYADGQWTDNLLALPETA